MLDDETSSNIDWEQDKGFGDASRQSRRIDVQKVLVAEAKERNSFKARPTKHIRNLPTGLRKLRNKIKDVYDEEDEEEEEIVIHFSFEDENSSLVNALRDEEKNKLQVSKTLENKKMQQTAGKMEAIIMADKMSKQLGLKGLKKKVVQRNIQDIGVGSEVFSKAVSQNVAEKTRLKTDGLSAKDAADMMKGLQKVQRAATEIQQNQNMILDNLKADELIKIGKQQDEKKTAEMILEKSGRKEPSKKSQAAKKKNQQKIKAAIKQANLRE